MCRQALQEPAVLLLPEVSSRSKIPGVSAGVSWKEKHLWLPSIFLGRRQLLIWPKGVKSAMRSLRVASKATLRTTNFVPLPMLPDLASDFASFCCPAPEGLRMLSCSTSLCPSSTVPCKHPSHSMYVLVSFTLLCKPRDEVPSAALQQVQMDA